MGSISLNSAAALIVGALAVAAPQFLAFLEPSSVTLIQMGLIFVAAAFISQSVVTRNKGIENIVASFALIAGGLFMITNITATVPTTDSYDYYFDSKFSENGTLSTYMEEDNGVLTLNQTEESGTYQSDNFEAQNNYSLQSFEDITVDMKSYEDLASNTVELRIRTYGNGNFIKSHTYTVNSTGLSSYNVSKINSITPVDSFDYRILIDSNTNKIPEFDALRLETRQKTEVETGSSGILKVSVLMVYVLGGILVAARIFTDE